MTACAPPFDLFGGVSACVAGVVEKFEVFLTFLVVLVAVVLVAGVFVAGVVEKF